MSKSTKDRMRKSWLVLAVLVAACRASEPVASLPQADAAPTQRHDAEPAPRLVVTEFGREIDVRWLALTARDSRNSEFVLCFQPVGPVAMESALVVALDAQRIGSAAGHRVDDATWHRCLTVAGDDARALAEAAGLELARYVGRDVRLAVRVAAEAAPDAEGRRVPMKLVVRNDGAAPVLWNWGGWQRGANRHGRMRYTATRDGVELAVLGETISFGGLGTVKELKSGESLEELDDLAAWFDFSTPGLYRVHAEYDLTIVEPVPEFSSATVCPRIASECVQILEGDLEFTARAARE
ncbi:MAG: hypothetical protein HZA52_12295 [Planctomycetes bacterium]|nr:hypothetical protein [Planctomycetota bacterium]